ncbi:hypothetical protein [Streptomyces sp. MZ04]|uniref:hypothetical protein n=1 Tax=Streptomyces sp. MZ04 TaxID=2559236 RepID=UPI00107ED95B|nr:hypothetical protein [Streptomyces sp. MZ04]TGB13294.1 hypothetical protein E2651_09775 [Streptomyces sp. MZ04]
MDPSHTEATDGTAHGVTEGLPVGALVVDVARMKLGRLMGHEGPRLRLRPPAGGREWEADPDRVRLAHGDEILRASVAEVSHAAPGRTP